LISDFAEELEMLKEAGLLVGVDIAMATGQGKAPYKACLFPLLVTTHQELGGSTSTLHHRTGEIEEWTLHHRTGEIEEWTLHHRTGENHHPGPEERAEDTARILPSQTSELNLLFGGDAPVLRNHSAPARQNYLGTGIKLAPKREN
jgi:hypothetical protein